jgi:voltage-gated potassium channel Kch
MRLPLAILVSVVLAACVSQDRPATCDEPTATLEVTLTAEGLSPKAPAVCRDHEVTLVVDSSVDGTLHIHGYDEDVPATGVTAGEELRLEFTATRSGQFPIELHPDEDPRGVDVGVFTVYEP